MIAFADLTSRFLDLVGIVDITATESARVGEVLNAGTALVFSEGVPGLHTTFTGETLGDLTVTVLSHVAGTSVVVFNETLDGVLPRDRIKLGTKEYLIADVLSGTSITLGSPIAGTLSGAGTIKRCGFELADGGAVQGISRQGNSESVTLTPLGPAIGMYKVGVSRASEGFSVAYAPTLGKYFLSLVPPPPANTRYDVLQAVLPVADADLYVPDTYAHTILLRALVLWRSVNDEQSGVVTAASQAVALDSSDLRRNAAGSHGVMER